MSGFLGSLFGGGAGGNSMQGALMSALPGILGQIMGGPAGPLAAGAAAGGAASGIGALLQQFAQAGLGQQAQSWVSTGDNHPVTPQQMGNVFPQEQVQRWAQQSGVDPQAILAALAHVLPHAVDQATPQGTVPAPGAAPQMDFGSLIGRLMAR